MRRQTGMTILTPVNELPIRFRTADRVIMCVGRGSTSKWVPTVSRDTWKLCHSQFPRSRVTEPYNIFEYLAIRICTRPSLLE